MTARNRNLLKICKVSPMDECCYFRTLKGNDFLVLAPTHEKTLKRAKAMQKKIRQKGAGEISMPLYPPDHLMGLLKHSLPDYVYLPKYVMLRYQDNLVCIFDLLRVMASHQKGRL